MKKKIKDLICKYFGCNMFTEVYAFEYFVSKKPKYYIIERHICFRCGKQEIKYLAKGLSRVELLKQGWFITNR